MQSSIGTSLNIFRLIHPGLLGTLGKNMFNANLGDWQPERKVR
ncbi:hypothetical protein Plhal304r1_c059g0147551 [Plasmopara halstedii]